MKSKKYSCGGEVPIIPKVVCCFRPVCLSNCRFAVEGEESDIVKMRMMGKCGKWWSIDYRLLPWCWYVLVSSTLKRLPLESFGNIIPKSPLKHLHANRVKGQTHLQDHVISCAASCIVQSSSKHHLGDMHWAFGLHVRLFILSS